MYKKIVTDNSFITKNGSKHVPVATLADEYGGRAQIAIDDHCYVLYLKDSDTGSYKSTTHIFRESHEVISQLSPPK